MTRLRRARLAGALVALGIVVVPRITPGLLIQRAVLNYRSSRPRSLISPAARDRWKDVPNLSERENRWPGENNNRFLRGQNFSNWPRSSRHVKFRRALAWPTSLDDPGGHLRLPHHRCGGTAFRGRRAVLVCRLEQSASVRRRPSPGGPQNKNAQ